MEPQKKRRIQWARDHSNVDRTSRVSGVLATLLTGIPSLGFAYLMTHSIAVVAVAGLVFAILGAILAYPAAKAWVYWIAWLRAPLQMEADAHARVQELEAALAANPDPHVAAIQAQTAAIHEQVTIATAVHRADEAIMKWQSADDVSLREGHDYSVTLRFHSIGKRAAHLVSMTIAVALAPTIPAETSLNDMQTHPLRDTLPQGTSWPFIAPRLSGPNVKELQAFMEHRLNLYVHGTLAYRDDFTGLHHLHFALVARSTGTSSTRLLDTDLEVESYNYLD